MTAPTPQNTPLNNAPLTREALSRPTVGTIGEEEEGQGEHWGVAHEGKVLARVRKTKLTEDRRLLQMSLLRSSRTLLWLA
jgi:nucleosome assembly protein 1-like 1